MSTEKTLDGWLRPSFELRTLSYCGLAVPAVWVYSDMLGFSPFWQASLTAIGVGLSVPRLKSLWRIKKYQASLNVIDAYMMTTDELEWADDLQWIGKGFDYDEDCAQRVWDASKKHNHRFYRLPKFVNWLRRNEVAVKRRRGEHKTLQHHCQKQIAKISSKQSFNLLGFKVRNMYKPLPPVGGDPIIHASGFHIETDQYMTIDERIGHMIVFGQSRVGKTVWMRSQITQDLARKDGVAGVFDPKGDLELLGIIWSESKRLGRDKDFYVFLLGDPEISARYNAISSFSRLTAIAGRIANQMSGGGDSKVFQDFAFNFMTYVAAGLLEMGEQPTFKTMKSNIEDLEGLFNRYGRFLMKRDNPTYHEELKALETPKYTVNAKGEKVQEKLKVGAMKGREHKTIITDKLTTDFYERNPSLINQYFEGLRSTMKSDQQYTSKLTASLIPLLTKLTSGQLADIISPNFDDLNDNRFTFSWDKIIQRKGVFYVGLSSMQDEVVAEAVGNSFFADLVAKAGEINNNGVNKGIPGGKSSDITPIYLHCDEFQSLMGDEFIPLLNRSGSAGVRVTAYTQTRADIEAKLGDAAKANVVLGNFNSVMMFRVADSYTAEYLTEQVKEIDVLGLDVAGATTDGGAITPKSSFQSEDDESGKAGGDGFFGTRTQAAIKVEDHRPIISPATIMSLPKGQAFAYINRSALRKLRFPILKDASGEDVGDMTRIRYELKKRQQPPDIMR